MKVVEKSYNVLTIDVCDMTSGTPKLIGTVLDYQALVGTLEPTASGLQATVVVNALS